MGGFLWPFDFFLVLFSIWLPSSISPIYFLVACGVEFFVFKYMFAFAHKKKKKNLVWGGVSAN